MVKPADRADCGLHGISPEECQQDHPAVLGFVGLPREKFVDRLRATVPRETFEWHYHLLLIDESDAVEDRLSIIQAQHEVAVAVAELAESEYTEEVARLGTQTALVAAMTEEDEKAASLVRRVMWHMNANDKMLPAT